MPMSRTKTPSTSFLDEIEQGSPIPSGKLAYFEQRALNNFYSFVLERFLRSGLRKADLARRIGLSQPQLTRYLASPGNWTIATVQRLLLGIGGEEVFLRSVPLSGRTPQNMSVLDLLDDGNRPSTDSLTIELRPEPLHA